MKRRDAELCRNTTFMLSTKKNEIDVLRKIKVLRMIIFLIYKT